MIGWLHVQLTDNHGISASINLILAKIRNDPNVRYSGRFRLFAQKKWNGKRENINFDEFLKNI